MRSLTAHASVSGRHMRLSFSKAPRFVVWSASARVRHAVVPSARGVVGIAPNIAFERTRGSVVGVRLAQCSACASWRAAQRGRYA
jgi:hypothetical protein